MPNNESCIFNDVEVKNAVHKSIIDTPRILASQASILVALKDNVKNQNDVMAVHSKNLEGIKDNMDNMAKILKYIAKYGAIVVCSLILALFMSVGGGGVIKGTIEIIKDIISIL